MLVEEANAFGHPATQELKINDIAELTGPYGDFILDEASTRPLIFIAEGAGYPPIKSLIQHALSLNNASSIASYWLAGSSGHYQENLPRSYASAFDNFRYIPFASDVGVQTALEIIAARYGFLDCDIYAAGSPSFLERTQASFMKRGLLPERWHSDLTPIPKVLLEST